MAISEQEQEQQQEQHTVPLDENILSSSLPPPPSQAQEEQQQEDEAQAQAQAQAPESKQERAYTFTYLFIVGLVFLTCICLIFTGEKHPLFVIPVTDQTFTVGNVAVLATLLLLACIVCYPLSILLTRLKRMEMRQQHAIEDISIEIGIAFNTWNYTILPPLETLSRRVLLHLGQVQGQNGQQEEMDARERLALLREIRAMLQQDITAQALNSLEKGVKRGDPLERNTAARLKIASVDAASPSSTPAGAGTRGTEPPPSPATGSGIAKRRTGRPSRTASTTGTSGDGDGDRGDRGDGSGTAASAPVPSTPAASGGHSDDDAATSTASPTGNSESDTSTVPHNLE